MLYRHPHHLCDIIATDKLKVNQKLKTKTFFVCLASLSDENLMKNKKNKETGSIFYYCMVAQFKFLFLSHYSSFVFVFVLFFGNIFKVKTSFRYYDLIISLCFVFNINSYTFVLYLCIKMWHINFGRVEQLPKNFCTFSRMCAKILAYMTYMGKGVI